MSGARRPMWCSTWPLANRHGGGYAHLPRRQPHGPGQGQDAAGRRDETAGAGATALPRRCPPLVDPARTLRVPGAQAAVSAMHRGGLLRFGSERGKPSGLNCRGRPGACRLKPADQGGRPNETSGLVGWPSRCCRRCLSLSSMRVQGPSTGMASQRASICTMRSAPENTSTSAACSPGSSRGPWARIWPSCMTTT